MAQGYLPANLSSVSGMSTNALLYCKTNIAGYFFDGYLSVGVNSSLEITQNPVETGASIVDHAYVKPTQIRMDIIMSDVHQSLVPGQFSGTYSRSVKAYDVLKKIQEDRIPVSVLCRLGLYENMLIQSLSADDDADTYRALKATVNLVEIPIARVKKVKISKVPQTTGGTGMGTINPVEAGSREDLSILYQLLDMGG